MQSDREAQLEMDQIQSTVAPVSHSDNSAVQEKESGDGSSASIDEVNKRRLKLIDKVILSDPERLELEELQNKMSAYVNARYPLPFAALERLEEYAQSLRERENRQ